MNKANGKDSGSSDSCFPMLIAIDNKLQIIEHHEIPIGKSFTVIETAPLTPENVLEASSAWFLNNIDDIIIERRGFK